ncbi:MocR-like pyridoxine biosynthesis transcription factor PdxR [Pectobacterium aroidearum]|uniref:MocR-like pyridoxine biosynthesis transcription factor PdxR n=1 Tax=Pectobacterium aroidearum TaxID=1201031 RepID=UPI002113B8D5|nr:PLP-dependent aminotransferase family protein [Pectobacterium aroidearum]UUE45496.1 PLP-dependent aminotransferase family protein [Pectobacterium aroidearum]UUE49717.1 PLP-dependent aminotransferase family protein [Pectobacterium aroidearum]UUE53921.1 PLP-dependent aminotransferase family protein [Pectobacterium aroidearum]UUE62330.1 PLP-dependent aminotransferase family protein [Pectobacterium aroidearum]UUE66553.1 PLP-dependent aminotransferase family protein [Pectobacterium aroidearum]
MFKHAQLESVKAWIGDPAQGALPLHARIQRAIRQLILDGVLDVGKALPASRALAKSLGVSRDTVESAYSQLHAEGFIERRIGSGSFVSERAKRLPGRGKARKTGDSKAELRLSQRGSAMFQNGGVRDFIIPRAFAPGVPETRSFPLQTWERLERQVLKEYGTRALLHSPPQGMEVLRRAIADYVNLERGARATPDRVLVLTSSQQALTLCANVLLDAGDRIFLEDPVYHGARKAFEAAGLACVPIPLDADGLQVEHLLEASNAYNTPTKAVFLTPSHQFPTGATLALDRRLAVIEWAWQHQSWIIEDDYDSEFHYAGKPTACVQGLDSHDRTIYIGTFTKSLFPGLRIGYMVLPPQLVAPMTVARTLMDGHSAPIPQLTLARFIEGGHFGAYVRTMRAVYAERRDVLARLVRQHLADFVEPQVPTGGMQMPCLFIRDIPEHDAVESARRAGIDLLGLTALCAASGQHKAGFLMGFAAHAPHELDIAVKTLAKVLRALCR